MSEKHEWVSDDLCLIEKTTGVKFYGTVCTDMEFLGKYMNDLINENEQLKKTNGLLSDFRGFIDIKQQGIKDEKQQKRFLKIHDDYYIQYGDDKELFNLHKPADIRSLCIILNREHGFSELQCEYNDKELKYD